MTTPNQSDNILEPPSGSDLVGLLGQGAYTISDSGTYGQNVTDDYVNNLVYGPLAPSNVAANSSSLTDVISVMSNLLTGIPVSTLKYLQPFIPGATDADFADSATASAFITNTFVPKMVVDTTNWVTRFVQDIEVLFDFFHITYPAGSPTDTATTTVGGKMTWYAAWADFLDLVGLTSGTTPTSAAPTIGTSITSATSWVTRLMQDLEILFDVFHLTYNAGSSGDAPGTLGVGGVGAGKPTWYSAWNDVLQLIGLATGTTPTTPAPTIGSAITTAQSSATSAGTTATTASTWATRLTNDLLITSDVFHVVYNVGTSTDAPGTLGVGGVGPGKPTWYSAWNDLKALTGTVNGVSAPTDAAPAVASAITTAQSTATSAATTASTAATAASTAQSAATSAGTAASTAQTTANTNATRVARKAQNDLILGDWLHVTYPLGSITDTAATLVGGKRTWWGAWNDNLTLLGVLLGITAPTDPASDVGTVATTAQAAASTAQDTAVAAGNDAGSALYQLTAVPAQNVVPVDAVSGQPVALVASGAGNTGTGIGNLSVSWTDTIPSTANYVVVAANTATTHNGTVSANVGGIVMSRLATVTYASSGTVTLFGLANPPVGSVTVRVDARDSSSLFSMATGTSMSFSNVASVSTATSSNSLNANPSLSTAFTSSQFVVNAIGTFGTAGSAVGLSSYNRTSRYHAGNFNGGSQFNLDLIAGTVSGVSSPNFTASVANLANEGFASAAVALNPPPTILGSYARAYRASTSTVGVGVNTALAGHYANVFDTSVASTDMTVDFTTGRITVAYSGTYLFKVGLTFTGLFSTQTMDGFCLVNGQLFEGSAQEWYASSNQTRFTWSTPVYLNALDYVEPGCLFGTTATLSVAGDSAGTKTFMSLSLLNRSLL